MNDILTAFDQHGRRASFHYADDTTAEWGAGDREKAAAMRIYHNNTELQQQMEKIATGFLWSLKRELRR